MNTYYRTKLSGSPFIPFSLADTSLRNSQKSIKKYTQKRLYFDLTIANFLQRLGIRPQIPIASGGWAIALKPHGLRRPGSSLHGSPCWIFKISFLFPLPPFEIPEYATAIYNKQLQI